MPSRIATLPFTRNSAHRANDDNMGRASEAMVTWIKVLAFQRNARRPGDGMALHRRQSRSD
jgi:hypothetical protein